MMHSWTVLGIGMVLVAVVAGPVTAQDIRPAVFGAVAVANVYRTEDQSFGTKPNIGAGAGTEWKRLGVDVEVHRTIGLTPRPFQCGVGGVPCVGSARQGLIEATMLSGNVSYFFGDARMRPYVTGSVGVLCTESINSLTIATATGATLSEFHERGRPSDCQEARSPFVTPFAESRPDRRAKRDRPAARTPAGQ